MRDASMSVHVLGTVACWYYPGVLIKELGEDKKILRAVCDPGEF
jgi:hypothetical protein